jgi:hypothetical protein
MTTLLFSMGPTTHRAALHGPLKPSATALSIEPVAFACGASVDHEETGVDSGLARAELRAAAADWPAVTVQ